MMPEISTHWARRLHNSPQIETATSLSDRPWLAGAGEPGLVSVIVPTFNRAAMTIELLDNLAAQSWPAIETIIVDDGSTDASRREVRRWMGQNPERRVTLIAQPNAGPGSARNRGLAHARGEFIYFIDSDDLIYPFALERMVQAIQTSKLAYCLATIETAYRDGIAVRLDFEGRPCLSPDNILHCRWMTHGALYRRQAVAQAGPFNTALPVGEDTDFQWRVVARNGPGHVLAKTVGVRREHDKGHLSVGRDLFEISRTNVAVFRSYFDWARREGRLTGAAAGQVAHSCLMAGLSLSYRGDRRYAEMAFATIAEARSHGVWWAPLAIMLTRPRLRGYYAPFWFALRLGKKLRNRWRSLQAWRWRSLASAEHHPSVTELPSVQTQ